MIAHDKPGAVAKPGAQFVEAFRRALAGGIVADADKTGITGVIAVGHKIVRLNIPVQKPVELSSLFERMAHPVIMPVKGDASAEQGIANGAQFIIVAAGAFGLAGIMNVAE